MGRRDWSVRFFVDGMRLEHVSEFNIWDAFWTNRVLMRQCRRKMASGRGLAGGILETV